MEYTESMGLLNLRGQRCISVERVSEAPALISSTAGPGLGGAACNPSTWQVGMEGLGVQGHPQLPR